VNPVGSLRVVDLTSTTPPSTAAPVAVVHREVFAPTAVHRPAIPAAPSASAPGWAAPLGDIERARSRIDGLLAEARQGRTFSAQELLCLQADAHRFSQSVEFAARAVEHGVQGLRQALQAQV
jgi:hypothetical protein